MSHEPLFVLENLVKSGIWSRNGSVSRSRAIVIDVDSIVGQLYRDCIDKQLAKTKHANDLYSDTLIDFALFTSKVDRLIESFLNEKTQIILVYEGKNMEAPLFGLLAAEFEKNTEQVKDIIASLWSYDKSGHKSIINQLNPSSLALLIFKKSINRRFKPKGTNIKTVQAHYSALPVLAKLARDNKCRVLTNRGIFILMDCRLGFILFSEYWTYLSALYSTKSSKSKSRSSPKLSASKRRTLRIHYNSMFLRQHPGLNAPQSANLLVICLSSFMNKYSPSLRRIRMITTDERSRDSKSVSKSSAISLGSGYQTAANRLEMSIRFLAMKDATLVSGLIRSEALRTKSSLDDDFRNLFNSRIVAFDFKRRLRFVLKSISDPIQLDLIESCLTNRECNPEFLLSILCCSIGGLASVVYNKSHQFEDLRCQCSAFSTMNQTRSLLIETLRMDSRQDRAKANETRQPGATLSLVDRQRDKLVEYELEASGKPEVDRFRQTLSLAKVAHKKFTRDEAARYISLAFDSEDLTKQLPSGKIDLNELGKEIGSNFAIMRSLFVCAFTRASKEDKLMKSVEYKRLAALFECAILNYLLFMEDCKRHAPIAKLINERSFDQYITKATHSSKSSVTSLSATIAHRFSKEVRHLIELLNVAIETYCQMNAFLDYPLAKLDLLLKYNPILLYNLTIYLHDNPKDGVLIKF